MSIPLVAGRELGLQALELAKKYRPSLDELRLCEKTRMGDLRKDNTERVIAIRHVLDTGEQYLPLIKKHAKK